MDAEYFWFSPDMTSEESAPWARWFRQHGISLSGGRAVLVWRHDSAGYAMRDVARRRIGWRDKHGHDQYLQLESPPLPFPIP